MMDRFVSSKCRVALLAVLVGLALGLSGCAQQVAPKSDDAIKAFAGDPAKKAAANKADIEKAALAPHPTPMMATPGPPAPGSKPTTP